MLAYTRCVRDSGLRGDPLKVALRAPWDRLRWDCDTACAHPNASAATNPYRAWIAEYARAPYQEVAIKARAYLDERADRYATPTREVELMHNVKQATRLESDS
jgi:thiaminase/transcriptional activator TenA